MAFSVSDSSASEWRSVSPKLQQLLHSALRFLGSSFELLLFSSNNRLISGLALLTGYRLVAFYLDLIFLTIKVLSLAL